MLGFKNDDTIFNDMKRYLDTNGMNFSYGNGACFTWIALIESRITNNLMLISNPALCSELGLDVEDLYTELRELMTIRKKISFGKSKEEATERHV